MDALKRAELAKQQGQQEQQPDGLASGLSLEVTVAEDTPATLPELPSKLEDLDAEFMAHAQPASARSRKTPESAPHAPATPSAAAASDREAVRNSFAAKDGLDNSKKVALTAAGLGLLAVGLIGVWLWLAFKPEPGMAVATRATAPMGQDGSVRSGGAIAAAPESRPPAPAAGSPGAGKATQLAQQDPSEEQVAPSRAIARRATATPAPTPRLPPADASIRVTSARTGIDPGVAEGYRQLQAGNLAAAKAAYSDVLRNDPRNADGWHGIAAIALRQGKFDDAEAAYLRILEANPADPAAQAALVGLNGQGDPVAGESRMKSLLAAQGDQPAVNFALGNLYARQQRWNEAQQAYFKAMTADAGNPDYLFNLAVSLDQLRQPKLAAQYYGQAITAAESRPAAFDKSLAANRLRELQP
jgi:tetratricopeptide (TPR) repeat protein